MRIFSFAPQRLGGIDMLLPLFQEIRQQNKNTHIEMIFSDAKPLASLKKDDFLRQQAGLLVDKIWVLDRQKYLGLVYWFRILCIAFRILQFRDAILLHSRDSSDRRVSLLRTLCRFRNGRSYRHFNGLVYLQDRTPLETSKTVQDDDDGFLCFSPFDIPYLEKAGHKRIIPVGYTRLYESWTKTIKSAGKPLRAEELKKLGAATNQQIILVYIPSTVEDVFNKAELRAWVPEVVGAVKDICPGAFVLLKPHPMQDMTLLNEIVENIGDANMGISFLHAGVLASEADIAISHHSSAIIDSMSLEIPTIQHQVFTSHWMDAHPEGSSFLKIGPVRTQSVKELEEALQKIICGEWSLPDVTGNMMHKTDISELSTGPGREEE